MTSSQRKALLWFLGGGAFLAAGLMETPHRLLAIVAAILYFAVGIVTQIRGRTAGGGGGQGC